MFKHVDYLESVSSTNDYLKEWVEAKVPRMAVAREQTRGKGRYGRFWESPAGQGLYVSYLLYPCWNTEKLLLLNALSSLAVWTTIMDLTRMPCPLSLKDPNDILLGDRKVAGILTELGTLDSRVDWAIIGIGVNLYQKNFSGLLGGRATSLHLAGIEVAHPLSFCDSLTENLIDFYEAAEAGKGSDIIARYQQKLSS